MKQDYVPGQFHPSFFQEYTWYRCHPSFGVMPFRKSYSLDECLTDLGSMHAWNKLDEESQDRLTDGYSSEFLKWFANAHAPTFYFAGAYEQHEQEKIKKLGIGRTFHGQWDRKYEEMLTNVNVHEFALVAGDLRVVVFESWDNIVTTVDKSNIPEKFVNPWV